MNLSGKIALVTGASRGIGESLAIGLADHGTDVIICDLESESKGLANTHKQIEKTGKKCWSYFLDVTKKSQIQKMVSDILNDIGSIDILVNNAGILTPTSLEDIDEETWDSHFEVNTKGVLLMCQSVLPHMREKKFGRIINIASIAGRQGSPTQGHYAVTKSDKLEAKNTVGPIISFGSPNLFNAATFDQCAISFSLPKLFFPISVKIIPGHIALTVIPASPTS